MDEDVILISQIENQRSDYLAASITGYDTYEEPKITKGTILNHGGSLVEATSTGVIANSSAISIGTKGYIVVPNSLESTATTISFSTIEPVWDKVKNNWVNDDNEIYIGSVYKENSTLYTQKEVLYPDIHSEGDLFDISISQELELLNISATSTGTIYKEFEVVKPISTYILIDGGSGALSAEMNIEIWQDSAWKETTYRTLKVGASIFYANKNLNPSKYRLKSFINAGDYFGGTILSHIYILGAYGTDSMDLDKVVITT